MGQRESEDKVKENITSYLRKVDGMGVFLDLKRQLGLGDMKGGLEGKRRKGKPRCPGVSCQV